MITITIWINLKMIRNVIFTNTDNKFEHVWFVAELIHDFASDTLVKFQVLLFCFWVTTMYVHVRPWLQHLQLLNYIKKNWKSKTGFTYKFPVFPLLFLWFFSIFLKTTGNYLILTSIKHQGYSICQCN